MNNLLNEQFTKDNLMDIVWVFYSDTPYDKSKINPITYDDFSNHFINKPFGGLWASPVGSKFGWKDWCEREESHLEKLKIPFKFTLAPNAKIYVIDDFEDLKNISTRPNIGYKNLLHKGKKIERFNIDYGRLIEEGYDGLFVTYYASKNLRYTQFPIQGIDCFECESLCLFNTDAVVPYNEN